MTGNIITEQAKTAASRGWKDKLTPLERAALTKIRELEKEIYDNYGLRLVSGAELEFLVRDKEGKQPEDKALVYKVLSIKDRKKAQDAWGNKLFDDKHLDLMKDYSKSKHVEKIYEEEPHTEANGKKIHQYEIVIGRELKLEGKNYEHRPAKYRAPSIIANVATIVKQQVENKVEQYLKPETKDNYYQVKYAEYEEQTHGITCGLHISMSVWNGTKNILADNSVAEGAVTNSIIESCFEIHKLSFPLVIQSQDSISRLTLGKSSPKELKLSESKDHGSLVYRTNDSLLDESFRLEFRTPGIASNIITQTLIATIGFYNGLLNCISKAEPHEKPDGITVFETEKGIFKTLPIKDIYAPAQEFPLTKKNFAKAVNDFENSFILEEFLGEELHKAFATEIKNKTKNISFEIY
jgi:hypothetical protein